MSLSPNSSLVRRTIDLNYAKKQRSIAVKWILINGVVLLVLTYDLWYKCGQYTEALHYVEAACAAALSASLCTHVWRSRAPSRVAPLAPLAPHAPHTPVAPLTPALTPRRADWSPVSQSTPRAWSPAAPAPVSPPRAWSPPAPAPGAPAPGTPPSPPATSPPATSPHTPRDYFIADRQQLDEYLSERSRSEWSESAEGAGGGGAGGAGGARWGRYSLLGAPAGAALYQLAPLDTESAKAPPGGGETSSPHVWRQLHVDPLHLTQFTLNLRRWLHATVLARLVRELDDADALLARAGHDARVGAAAPQRLRALAAAAAPPLAARLRALLPFLAVAADQAYLAARVRELARGGCLAAYRWDGGGAGWAPGKPTDAELVHALFAAYLESVAPGASAAPPCVVRAGGEGAVFLLRTRGGEAVAPAPGRHNLLHALLLLVAAAAREAPPALRRLHLGPAGLNMLWIIGR